MLITLTDDQIKKALEKCKYTCEWAPSIAEFRNAALDIIPAGQAWILAKNNKCNNRLVNSCKAAIKSWSWANKNEDELRREFIDVYNLMVTNEL